MLDLNVTDILSMMISPLVENYWWELLLMIIGGIVWYLYRYDFTDTYRQRKYHTAEAVKWIAFPSTILIVYLCIHQHYWILSFMIAGATVYLLDRFGIIDFNISR